MANQKQSLKSRIFTRAEDIPDGEWINKHQVKVSAEFILGTSAYLDAPICDNPDNVILARRECKDSLVRIILGDVSDAWKEVNHCIHECLSTPISERLEAERRMMVAIEAMQQALKGE